MKTKYKSQGGLIDSGTSPIALIVILTIAIATICPSITLVILTLLGGICLAALFVHQDYKMKKTAEKNLQKKAEPSVPANPL